MNDIIINGIPDGYDFAEFESKLETSVPEGDHYFKLRDMNIGYCQGCWDCWVKTPGVCRMKDDYEQILSKIPHADHITVITPIIAGCESGLVKRFKDRNIPLLHPYIVVYKGEQHHKQRYRVEMPTFNVIVLEDDDTDAEDVEILTEFYERMMLNFHSSINTIIRYQEGDDMQDVINSI